MKLFKIFLLTIKMAHAIEKMIDYKERMAMLLGSPEISDIWTSIIAMPVGQIVTMLLAKQLSIAGTLEVLRERLFRIELRTIFTDELDVPFCEEYDCGNSSKIFLLEAYMPPKKEEIPNVCQTRGTEMTSDNWEEIDNPKIRDLGNLGEVDKNQEMSAGRGENNSSYKRQSSPSMNHTPIMTTASIPTTSILTTTSHTLSSPITTTVMTTPQPIISATMAPSVISLHQSVSRLSVSPEIKQLLNLNKQVTNTLFPIVGHGYNGLGNNFEWPLNDMNPHLKGEKVQDCYQNQNFEQNDKTDVSQPIQNKDKKRESRPDRNIPQPVQTNKKFLSKGGISNNESDSENDSDRSDKLSTREKKISQNKDKYKRQTNKKYKEKNVRRTLFTDSSSESDPDISSESSLKSDKSIAINRSKTIKTLINWGIKFSGDDNADPEDFLDRLEDCKIGMVIDDDDLIHSIPSILKGQASRWYRTIRREIDTWKMFKRAFRREFLTTVDDDEVIDELRARTQAKGEKISSYLTSLRLIMGHLKRPLPVKQQVKIAYKGLTPIYRRQVDSASLGSLTKLEKNLRQYEKVKDLDDRYVPPPSKDKMRFPAAAFHGSKKDDKAQGTSKHEKKVAAIEDEDVVESSEGEKKTNMKGEKKKKDKKTKGEKKVEKTDEKVDALNQTVPTTLTPAPAPNAAVLYAAMTAGKWKKKQQQNNPFNTAAASGGQVGTASNTGAPTPFYGACFSCQSVGHRVSECPLKICFVCQQPGHIATHCPNRIKQTEICLVCKTPGVNFLTCPNCVNVRNALGNGPWGAQPLSVPPTNPPQTQ